MNDTTSLPSQDSALSDDDQNDLLTYVARITPHDKFSFQQAADFLKENSYYLNYLISRESSPQDHFHIVIQTDESYGEELVRADIRSFLIPYWESDEHKLPRGFGNKQYNLQKSADVDGAVSYAVKEGNELLFEGFTEEYIDKRKAESFRKNKPVNFKAEYIELCKKFQESEMDMREFMIDYCNLKAKYGQLVNLQHAYGYALSNVIKRENNASDFVEDFLYKH